MISIRKFFSKEIKRSGNENSMNTIKVYVRGMTCSHCKMKVENNIKKLSGVENTTADLDSQVVTITGDNIDLKKIQETVEGIGYKFDGKLA
jgi:copper chaperone CopZ